MATAVLKKSVKDLTRRKARALFAVLTLAFAVAGVGVFAAPSLMDRAMQDEVEANRLPDLTLSTKPLEVTPAQLAELGRLPNVRAAGARSYFQTRVWVGERRVDALVIGVPDFARQPVNVVSVVSGAAPDSWTVLTDVQNEKQGRYAGVAGDELKVIGVGDRTLTVRVAGVGRNLVGGQYASDAASVVLYTTPKLIERLGADPGFSSLEFRLDDASAAAADRTVDDVAAYLKANTAFTSFSDLPDIREPGTYPGKDLFDQLASLMNVFTVLALISALVLIANTMTTLIGEQRREIGMMKAIGGTRRQISRVYLRTALLLGAAGSVVGVGLGVLIANAIVRYFGSSFFAISPGFDVVLPVVIASIVLGLVAPPLAALPAIRRGARVPVREGLEEVPALEGGQAVVDRALRRLGFMPRTAQIGVRSVTRRARRSLGTVVQIGLAVATLLGVLALVNSVTQTTNEVWDEMTYDLTLDTVVGKQFDAGAERLIRDTPGVARAQPMLANGLKFEGDDAFAMGLADRQMFAPKLIDGRWYTPAESASNARVAVIAENIARVTGTEVGDEVTLETAAGPASFRIVGETSNQWNNGLNFYVPLSTLQEVLGTDTVNGYFVGTTSGDHDAIDRTTTRLENRLAGAGYAVDTQVKWSGQEANVRSNRQISSAIALLGLLVVAISMVGLINAITMSVLERTREIGVLRCIGARARDIRRIFTAEGLAVAVAGWLVGIPLGYALARTFIWLMRVFLNIEFAFTFPPLNLLIALVGTVVLALLIMRIPLRRAVRLKPGDAIRYA
ncbi:MAG TPA: FtsX-like permease family protein [Gaiellaceae bacterium]|nr:FtsX-like permease family protein [Gaiellaceae bacterium]